MDEQTKMLADAVLAAPDADQATEMYLAAPKALRRGAYSTIREKNAALGKKIRAAAEKQRGIAFRTQEGVPVLSREEYQEQVVRLARKQAVMDERKVRLAEKMVEYKKQAQDFYGDDFLAELEAAIENV